MGDRVRSSEYGGQRVVCFGEAMIRLTPPGNERVERTTSLNLSPGGAELNTAVTLACLGLHAQWVSRLPDNALGGFLDRQAKAHGVDMSAVEWVPDSEGRMGLYFLEEGVDPRPSAVTYDRAASAMARVTPGAFDWTSILKGASAFHISGITPAISQGARAESFAAMQAANEAGVPVFFDLNYRSKLWTIEEAKACFVELAPMIDVLFAGRGSMGTFFGIEGDHEEVMRGARTKLGVAACVLTRKKAKASRALKLKSMTVGPNDQYVETDWRSVEIVDRLGGGDAFAGGFIAGYLENSHDLTRAVNLGLAASALKHTVPGDFLAASRSEIEAAAVAENVAVLQR